MSRLWDIVKHRLVQYKKDPVTGGIANLTASGRDAVVDLQLGKKTSSQSIVTLAVVGDSTARNQYSPINHGGLVGDSRMPTVFGGFVELAAYMTGGLAYPDLYAYEGYSGQKTDQILASFLTASATENYGVAETIAIGIQARKPTITFDTSGTNDMIYAPIADMTSGDALARCIAGRRQIWAFLRACGSTPVAVSLFPAQGSYQTSGSCMTQEQLIPYKVIWNAALKAAALQDGVAWLDAYTPCADGAGHWKPGYIRHNGVDDTYGIHPSLLASMAIAPYAAAIVCAAVTQSPRIPRLYAGGSPVYSAAFVASDKRQYFGSFAGALFPDASSWSIRSNPQANMVLALSAPSQDANGGTLKCSKPATNAAGYGDSIGTNKTVIAGQEYLWFADIRFYQCDGYAALAVNISDQTPASGSFCQPICSCGIESLSIPALSSFDSGVLRVAGYYRVPVGVTTVAPMIVINRDAGGASTGEDAVYISNFGQLRLS